MVISVWFELALALIGGGVMTQGVIGLAMGGNLPGINVPQAVRPLAQLLHIISIFIGITLLLHFGTHDLLARLLAQLMA